MATVLCPSLVALDPVPCNDPKCSASHTHTPAFCDPCKAVHAQVHSSIHLASIGHRLRVDGPVAPVRCIVCCPLGTEPVAQFLFIGPEHYAVHARTSAHRAKLAKFPTRKPEAAIGLGRPGDRSFAMDRPYAPRSATPPRSMTMPASGPGSRSSTSMSFGGDGGISAPPGPAPVPLGESEYVLCTLCHTVLPVPPVDPAYAHDPKLRIASQGSDATIVGSGQGPRRSGDQRRVSIGVPKKPEEQDEDEDDNDHDGTSTILTTTDPKAETETRKSLVLAHHNAHDTEHARRMRFPRFKEAWERRMRKQTLAAGEETPPEEEHAPGAVLPGQIAASPSQLSLSSLSASPSVAMMGLDGDDVYETYTRAREVFDNRSSVSAAPRPPPPPPPPPEPEEESLVDWESKLRDDPSPPRPQPRFTPRSVSSASSSSAPSASDEGRTYSIDSNGKRFGRDSSGRAFPVDENGRLILNNGTLPVQIPAHLLPFMSPMTPSMAESLGLDSGSEDGFKDPGPPPPLPTPSATTTRKSVSPKPTAMVFKDPGPPPPLPKPQPRASTSSPQPRQVSSPQSRQTTFSPPPQARQPQPRQTSYTHPRQATASPQPRQTSFSYSRQVTASPLPMSTSSTPPPPPSISASVTSSTQSKPYVPSPSPPPRLAFDTYGRVLKLGMRGWEMDLSGEHSELQSATTEEPPSSIEPPIQPQPQRVREVTPEPPRSPSPPSDSLPSRSPSPEPEPEPERYGRPASPATEVGVSGDAVISAPRRYTLGQVRSVTSGTASRTVSASGSVGGGESSRASSSMSMHSTSTGGGSPTKGHTRSASSGLGLSGTGPGRSSTTSTGRSSTMSAGLGFGGVGTGFGGPGFGAAAGDRGSFPSTISGSSLADSLGVRGGGVAYPAHTTPAHANTISVYPSTTTPAYSGGSSIYQSRTTSSSSVKTTGSTGYTPPSLFQTTGPTTKVTRPVAPRRSTGEWTLLEGQGQGQSQREESGWSRPGSALSGGRLHKAPSPELSAIGDGEEEESESEPKSHSEASQLIREFAGKPTTSKPPAPARTPSPEHIPTPERKDSNAPVVTTVRIHSRTTSLSNRPAAATSTRPVTSTGSLSSRPSTSSFVTGTGSLSSRPVTSTGSFRSSTRPIGSTSSLSHRPVASTTPRAFSPSPAWKSLTPASPESQSSSEVDEFGAIGFGAEPSSFDEAKFLSDLGFGLGLEQRLRKSSPSPEPEPEQEEEEVERESSTPSREASPVRSASPPPRLSTPPIRVSTPPVRVSTPPARVASPIRVASPPIRVSTPPVRVSTPPVRASSPLARAITPTDSRPTTPTPAVSSISSPPRSSAPSRPSLPARNSTIRASASPIQRAAPSPPRSTPARNSTIRATPSPIQRAEPSPPRPTPARNSTIRARAPSPLQREVLEAAPPPPPVPVPASPVPAPSSPRDPKAPKPVMRTRVRARPMGTSSSVVSGGGGSVISGYGGRSVVSGYGGGSVVSGNGGGSVVSGYDGGSVVSGTGRSRADSGSSAGPPSPVVSQNRPSLTLPRQFDLRSRGDSIISDSEAPSSANRPSLSLPRPLELRSRGDSIISSDSEAPSSVVTPLSPRTRNTLRSHGLEVETPIVEERDSEVEEMADNLAGMNLRTTTDMDEARIGTIERVDTSSSGFTSPIVPDGAPSDAGSLFSRAVSPQPLPTIARMTVSRSGTPAAATTSTKTPPVTPPKATQRVQQGLDETPKSQRSAALPGGFSFRPESPVRGKGRATGSVFSRGPGSSYSRPGGDELKWKLDLPSHTSDPLTFQSLLGDVESEGGKIELGDTPKRAGPDAGEITNASPRSERLTPTRSSVAASEGPLKGPVGGANEGREEEEEQGGDEWEEVDEQDQDQDQEEQDQDQEEQEEVDGFTSSSEEGARTETATNTDGLDHLTESINEPFGLQLDNQPLVHEQPIFDSQSAHHQPNGKVLSSGPVYDSPRLVSPPALPGGFEAEPIAPLDPEFVEQPAGMEYYGEYEDQMSMPDEVLALRPVMCDACRAPMPLSKWTEHIAKAGHRRNAAHYAQWLFDQITAHHPAGPSRDAADTRERWAEASRLDPRDAHPSEYAFCEVCQVFLIRGDTEHFQGKKHLRCLRELAIHDADGLSSIRGSVSDEEDGPSAGKKQYRPMQVPVPVTASQVGVDWTQPRVRSRPASGLGHQAFPSANPTM